MTSSPAGRLATITWLEQDCAGFVLVSFGAEMGDSQLRGIGRWDGYYVQPNLIQGPVFSPDGRFAVASCTLWSWWAPGGNPETPSPGGRLKAGHIAILDTQTMTFTEREVFTDVAPGWLPPESKGFEAELMGHPEFTSDRALRIDMQTGIFETFDL